MKILMISHEYPPLGGGGGNACMNLAKEYVKKRHDVTVLTVWYEGLAYEQNREGVQLLRIPSKRKHVEHCSFSEMVSFLLKALPKADRLQRQRQFDVCQIFFAIPSGPIGYYLKKRYALPYVIRFGGGDIPGFQERFQTIYKLIGPFEKVLWKNAAFLAANSEGLKRMAEEFYDKKPIAVIPNGADCEMFQVKQRVQAADGCFRILFVSRLIERKGLQFVIPQLSKIQKALKKPIRLTIVGDGPYRDKLLQLVKEYGADAMTEFVGQKEKSELPRYYADADVFILPSKKEGMPNVVLEAMAGGLPVVMTPCEGSQELVQENGFIVSAEEFADPLIALGRDEELRLRMGRMSQMRVQKYFTWEKTAQAYTEIFEKVRKSKNKIF